MNDENNKYLNKKYSDMIHKHIYNGETLPFWFDCGDGWFTIINELCGDILNHMNNQKQRLDIKKEQGEIVTEEDYETIKVTIYQIKEKYGGLRFYTYGGDEYVRGMITFAESMSYKTCEYCGNPGKLSREGWWKTFCDPCRQDDKRRKEEWNNNYKKAAEKVDAQNGG